MLAPVRHALGTTGIIARIPRRLLTYSEAAPIAKEAEEQLLFKDMQLELADRILRQVAVARRDM